MVSLDTISQCIISLSFTQFLSEMTIWDCRQLWECDVHTPKVWGWLCIKYYINCLPAYSTRISHQYHVLAFRFTDQPIIVGRVDQHGVFSQWKNKRNHRISQTGAILLQVKVKVPDHRNENIGLFVATWEENTWLYFLHISKKQTSAEERVLTLHSSLQLI